MPLPRIEPGRRELFDRSRSAPSDRVVPLVPFETFLIFERLPEVVDSTALINDCLRFLRRGEERS